MREKILIYGFGRMGLTHYAILNQLLTNAEFTFIDPDRKVNLVVRKNLNVNAYGNDNALDSKFDYALICTPPMFHIPILRKCIDREIANIFVEKPFGGIQDDFSKMPDFDNKIFIGYVLRFNPIIQWVKNNLDINAIKTVEGSYFSNTLEKKPKGWRNSSYSGVTNEVGAHIIDLGVHLFGLKNPNLKIKTIKSVISDVDDIVIAEFEEKDIEYKFNFDWVNKSFRKPVFKFIVFFKDGSSWKFDQQKLEIFSNGMLLRQITSVDIAPSVPYYLRGVDFTSQMQDFISSQTKIATVSEALISREIIKKILTK